MRKITLIMFTLLICAAQQVKAQTDSMLIRPTVDKRVELLSIVFRLTGNPEYSKKSFKDGLKTSLDGFWWLFLNNLIIIAVCASVCFALVFILHNIILALCLCFVVFCVATYFLNCSALVHYYENIGKPYFTKKVNIGLSDEG